MIPDPLAIAWMIFFVAVVFLAGDLFFGKFLKEESPLIRGILCMALGYGIIAYLLIFLGQFGVLRPKLVTFLLFGLIFFRFSRFKELFHWIRDAASVLGRKDGERGARLFQWVLLLLMSLTFLFCFLPEIAHDSLVYHINLPKLYAQTGSMRTNPYDMMSYRPLLLESLYSLAFLWKSLPLAKLIHWLTGVLLTLGLIRIVEKKTGSYRLAIFSGLMLFSTPLFMNVIQTTYTDVGTAFFACFAFYLFLRAMETRRPALFFLSGVLMGLAVSTKLLTGIMAAAMVFSFVVCGIMGWTKRKAAERREIFYAILVYGAGVLLAYGYWIGRNAIATGNPFFPYLSSIFSGPRFPFEREFITGGVPKTILNFLLLPVLVTFSPDFFDRHHYIGLIYLLGLPFFIYGSFKSDKVRLASLTTFFVFSAWFYLCQNYRYLTPVLPLLLCGGAWGFSKWNPMSKFTRILRRVAIGSAFFALVCNLGLSAYHFRFHLKALVSGSTSQQYLRAAERTFDIAQWVSTHLPKDARILSFGEIRAFYFDRAFVGEDVYGIKHPDAFEMNGEAFLQTLRRQGFSYLLVCSSVDPSIKSSVLFRSLETWIGKENGLKEVFQVRSRNQRETQCLYRLFELSHKKTGEGLI